MAASTTLKVLFSRWFCCAFIENEKFKHEYYKNIDLLPKFESISEEPFYSNKQDFLL